MAKTVKLYCPDCKKKLSYSSKLSKVFNLEVYVCEKCDDWGVLINGVLDWNFKVKE